MNLKTIPLLLVLLPALRSSSVAQQSLTGKVFSIDTEDALSRASVSNISFGKYTVTDYSGNYAIAARPVDKIVFVTMTVSDL